ncbi:class I SAM-dependent methyltransferase [Nocardia pseudovaccinii]|uniref:class I SAM-dependent methyltransferase n=1 Tax=Nocardia pseudovaccinii TaxID=189540 RepID=UPI0007A4969B|nr:methyltransferase domain-containing protein [Nocardia pseudovaccinii]
MELITQPCQTLSRACGEVGGSQLGGGTEPGGERDVLPFDAAEFDTVICTFGLCAIPDIDAAIAEMIRVLRPEGKLILVDHIPSSNRIVRGIQRLLETVTAPLAAEHFMRRPLDKIRATGLEIERVERFNLGIVERLTARKH